MYSSTRPRPTDCQVPPPAATRDKPLRALIFDSYYDPYRGVVVFIRIVDGELRKGDKVLRFAPRYPHPRPPPQRAHTAFVPFASALHLGFLNRDLPRRTTARVALDGRTVASG